VAKRKLIKESIFFMMTPFFIEEKP